MSELRAHSSVPVTLADAFAWHERPGALERLTPPWEPVEVVSRSGTIHDGDEVVMRMHLGPATQTWRAVHRDFVVNRQFVDVQEAGPFHRWVHTHRFAPDGDGTRLEDLVEYQLPLGALGRGIAGRSVRTRLERMFTYRHTVVGNDLVRHRGTTPMRIAVTGASGLIGTALCAFLSTGGHTVVPLVRRWPAKPGELYWDPDRAALDADGLEGMDAVVHLAGENVGARWTPERKERIRESRIKGTRLLAEAIARVKRPPGVFVSASAIGYYGDQHNDHLVEEQAPAGDGFLAEVCRAWEAAAQPATRAGVRVVHPRIGVVLTPSGGALAKLLPVFRAGAGGRVGSGEQGFSWIALDDAVYAIHRLLVDETLAGPVNVVAPEPVTNRELTRTLSSVLSRPAALPVPGAAVSLLFGEMGRETVLSGALVVPRRLLDGKFSFAFPSLEGALRHLLGRKAARPPSFSIEFSG